MDILSSTNFTAQILLNGLGGADGDALTSQGGALNNVYEAPVGSGISEDDALALSVAL